MGYLIFPGENREQNGKKSIKYWIIVKIYLKNIVMNKISIKEEDYSKRKFLVFTISGNRSFITEHLLKLEGIKWSEKKNCMYMERNSNDIGRIFNHIKGCGYYFEYSELKNDKKSKLSSQTRNISYKAKNATRKSLPPMNKISTEHVANFEKWMKQKRYSKNTINTYKNLISVFFRYYNELNVEDIGINEIESFNYNFIISNNFSYTYQNQTISAIKLFYLKMMQTKVEFELLERPRRSRPLPKVISKEHIKQLLSSIKNLKHKTAITMIYSLGLRRSELINLRLTDIFLERNIIVIRNAKGKKDRTLPLPEKLKELIIKYYKAYLPATYLIEGFDPGIQYSETSLRNIFKKSLSKIIKNHNFTLHCLRHSYATHLHDAGVDIRNIQELLGHKSSKTTEIYTYVSIRSLKNIANPIDEFDI